MSKKNRVARSKEDLEQELMDQLDLLRVSCTAYDDGIEAAGKTIATMLRVLLYSHNESRGLLDQLGYRNERFISSCEKFDDLNYAPRPMLLHINVTPTGVNWEPRAISNPHCKVSRRLPFAEWWSETIVLDGKGRKFTRMGLVKHVADTDGGAHVDPGLDDWYMDLTRGNSIGYMFGDQAIPFIGRPVLACMRQIAHEVLATLQKNAPELGERVRPVIPPYIEPAPNQPGQTVRIVGKVPEQFQGRKDVQANFSIKPAKRFT